MERKYFVPKVNDIYRNRNGQVYRCTNVVGNGNAETIAYFTRLSDGWSLAAHGPQIYEDETIEWDYSTGGHWPWQQG